MFGYKLIKEKDMLPHTYAHYENGRIQFGHSLNIEGPKRFFIWDREDYKINGIVHFGVDELKWLYETLGKQMEIKK